MAKVGLPSDVLPYVYTFLIDQNLHKAAKALKKETKVVRGERMTMSKSPRVFLNNILISVIDLGVNIKMSSLQGYPHFRGLD